MTLGSGRAQPAALDTSHLGSGPHSHTGIAFTEKTGQPRDWVGVIAVIVGSHGPGGWQQMEYHAAIQRIR